MKYVSYIRVSTEKQGASGLGLEAQQRDIRNYLDSNAGELLAEFEEIESGKVSNRPQLKEALAVCRTSGATLLIAKLDRLSRDLHFITTLQKANLDFKICDQPHADKFTIHIYAALAEKERDQIVARTRAALQSARERGVVLGRPQNLTKEAADRGRQVAIARSQKSAEEFAAKVLPIITRYLELYGSFASTARELNLIGIPSASGKVGVWDATKVRNVVKRGGRDNG